MVEVSQQALPVKLQVRYVSLRVRCQSGKQPQLEISVKGCGMQPLAAVYNILATPFDPDEHFRRIGEALSIPIIPQYYPPINGVTISPQAMAEMAAAVSSITTIKLEGTPTPQRTWQTLALTGARTSVLGGLGGMYMLDELRRGQRDDDRIRVSPGSCRGLEQLAVGRPGQARIHPLRGGPSPGTRAPSRA